MPFDPRLIHPDEAPLRPGGELDLPDDLAALAEQLGDDAAHLASRYPADRAPAVALSAELIESAARIKRQSRSRVALVVGTSLASIALLALTVTLSLPQREPAATTSGSVASAPAATDPAVVAESSELIPVPSPRPAAGTLSVGELSGPELEALLDLLNGEPKSVASISF